MKNAYPALMGEKSREELKQESYIRDQRLFAGRVTVRMEERSLTATDLAEKIGVSITAIQAILKGRTKFPRPETLFALADLLGLEARWLGIGEGPRLLHEIKSAKRQVLRAGREGAVSPVKNVRNRSAG